MPKAKQTYLPVRCCCNPAKILGYLPVPAPNRESFLAYDEDTIHCLQIGTAVVHCGFTGVSPRPDDILFGERAVVSDDRPLEFWRRLAGFVEYIGL